MVLGDQVELSILVTHKQSGRSARTTKRLNVVSEVVSANDELMTLASAAGAAHWHGDRHHDALPIDPSSDPVPGDGEMPWSPNSGLPHVQTMPASVLARLAKYVPPPRTPWPPVPRS